uniref:Tetratricopeptide repeat protein n=1 Tax=Eubacterium cellulosolvens (strain ATCC 43171 / JCM 9499 / 6) TaxID=633697 RepID=I5AXP1_EUBC6
MTPSVPFARKADNRYEEAKALIDSYLGKVLLSNSSKAVNYYNLGLIACENENPAEAIYRLKAAVDLGNHLFFVKDAEARLNEINERFVS